MRRPPAALVVAALLAATVSCVHALVDHGAVHEPAWIEDKVLDVHYHVRSLLLRPPRADPRLALVVNDDRSYERLQQYGSNWEFSADLLEKIAAQHPRVVFFDYDMVTGSLIGRFAGELKAFRDAHAHDGALSPDASRELAAIESRLDVPQRFLAALQASPTLLTLQCEGDLSPPAFADPSALAADVARLKKAGAFDDDGAGTPAVHVERFRYPHDEFAQAAAGFGHVCQEFDVDDLLRRNLSVISTARPGAGRLLLPSMPLLLASWALASPPAPLRADAHGVFVGDRFVPIDVEGETLLDFWGGRGTFRSQAAPGHPDEFSAVTILDDHAPAGALTDKVVLVGDTRLSSFDKKRTPFSYDGKVPGVEGLAIAANAILAPSYPLRRPVAADRWGFLLTLVVGVLACLAGQNVSGKTGLILGVAGGVAVLLTGSALFTFAGLWIDVGHPALAWGLALLGGGYVRYREQEEKRAFLQTAFSKYLAPEMVAQLEQHPEYLALGGEERELSMLFSDLRGFTEKMERLRAREMVSLLREHFTAMNDVILRRGGTLDKFVGDCVVCFWGAPKPDPDKAIHAVNAGLEMFAAMEKQNEARRAAGRETLDAGIGVATGTVIVGNMGSEQRFDYTANGDSMNLASRLESLTKEVGYGMLIDATTRERIGDAVPVDDLGLLKVKGHVAAIHVFGVRSTRRGVRAVESG